MCSSVKIQYLNRQIEWCTVGTLSVLNPDWRYKGKQTVLDKIYSLQLFPALQVARQKQGEENN